MLRHRLTLSAILVLIIIPLGYGSFVIFGNDILCLSDGRFIEAEKAWKIEDTIYYVTEGRMETMPGALAEKIISGSYSLKNVPALMEYHFIHKPRNAANLLTLMLIAGILTGFYLLMTKPKKNRQTRPANFGSAEQESAPPFPAADRLEHNFALDLVHFFLGVFRYQINAPETAPAHITSSEKGRFEKNYTYKLHIRHNGQWQSRYMTIGPIGEQSRSKSRCYYVIYDAHMVIKVPPKPLLDYRKYIENIRAEKKIADKLAPRQCLTPRVSSILRRIHKFDNESAFSAEQLEQRYRALLERRSELKRFLIINGSHVYFMDVARYYFLGPIVEAIHDRQTPVYEEILANPDIFWDASGFYGRYGMDTDPVRQQVIALYENFQARLNATRADHHLPADILRERGQSWFLKAMAGTPSKEIAKDLPYAFRKELGQLIENLSAENSAAIQSYRKLVNNYVNRVSASRNNPKINSIITNLLDLLSWLGECGIAIRDIKPDNLLVAGDPDRYPFFLNSAREYTIGLIDLETAVDFKPDDPGTLAQPALGGTLYYATPSHFIPNKALAHRLADPARIFYLQDWYAAIAIIFELVTGQYLFKSTARQLNQTIKAAKQSAKGSDGIRRLLRYAQGEFWRTAHNELDSRCKQHKARLESVRPVLPEDFHQWLVYELEATIKRLGRLSAEHIKTNPQYHPEHEDQQLLAFDTQKVEKLIKQYRDPGFASGLSEKKREKIINFFRKLNTYRKAQDHARSYLATLSGQPTQIAASDIMHMMFIVVQFGMRPR